MSGPCVTRSSQLSPPNSETSRRGTLASLLLHAVLLLLVLARLPWPPSAAEVAIPINLVRLTEKGPRAGGGTTEATPQEQAKEDAVTPSPDAVPVPGSAPPQASAETGPLRSAPEVLAAVTPAPRPAVPKPVKAAPPAHHASAPPQHTPSPEESLAAKLQTLSHLTQPAPPLPSDPRKQEGAGWSNVSAAGGASGGGRHAGYSVKDLIRQQVERRWNVNRADAVAANWTVSIHIRLEPDGTVDLAEYVLDPRYTTDKAWLEFARSARNAVYRSSPILLPPEGYTLAKDIVVDFDPRRASD